MTAVIFRTEEMPHTPGPGKITLFFNRRDKNRLHYIDDTGKIAPAHELLFWEEEA